MKANGASPAASSQSLSPPTGLLRTALLTAAITLTVYAPTVARDLTLSLIHISEEGSYGRRRGQTAGRRDSGYRPTFLPAV